MLKPATADNAMQGLHFFFSVGALVAPVLVGRFGYRAIFFTFGLLSMPAALGCCLSDGGGIFFCDRENGGERRPLVSAEPSLSAKGAARVEDLRFIEGGALKRVGSLRYRWKTFRKTSAHSSVAP